MKILISYKKLFPRNSLKNKIFEKRIMIIKKPQKINFILSFKPSLLNGQDYETQRGPGSNEHSLFRLQNKFRKILLLVIYYLTKFNDVI